MPDPAADRFLLLLGALFLLGLATDIVGRRTPLPRVSLLLLGGFLLGPAGAGLLADPAERWFPAVADMALVMVGFLLGGELTREALRAHGRLIVAASLAKALGAFAFVLAGLALAGVEPVPALLLAGAATATDPAATADVVHAEKARGALPETLLGVVAVDDAWGLLLFSLALAAAEAHVGGDAWGALALGARDVGGAIVLGGALGVPAALLTGRVEPGEPTLAEALGAVFLCGGLALWLEVSFLLAAMVMGATVANLATHHRRPFRAIEGIEWPFLILFFVLAGASLDVASLAAAGGLVALYVLLRGAGTVAGAWLGVAAARDPSLPAAAGPWLGASLMPQAGVALGMALVASQRLPDPAGPVLSVVVASTVLLEILGPILTRQALRTARTDEGPDEGDGSHS